MMELTSVIATLLLAMQAQPVQANNAADQAGTQAAPTSAEAPVDTAEKADSDDKIICRRTAIVGSKFKKKICGTKKQWETLANRGSDTTRDLQRSGKGLEPVN